MAKEGQLTHATTSCMTTPTSRSTLPYATISIKYHRDSPLEAERQETERRENFSSSCLPHVCKTIAVTPQEGLEICLLLEAKF